MITWVAVSVFIRKLCLSKCHLSPFFGSREKKSWCCTWLQNYRFLLLSLYEMHIMERRNPLDNFAKNAQRWILSGGCQLSELALSITLPNLAIMTSFILDLDTAARCT